MDSELITRLKSRCQSLSGIVALPECADRRIAEAAKLLLDWGAVRQVVFFDRPKWREFAQSDAGTKDLLGDRRLAFAEDICPGIAEETARALVATLATKQKPQLPPPQLAIQGALPLNQAGWLLSQGRVDAAVAGAVNATADVIRAALTFVGLRDGMRTVSGSFVMARENSPRPCYYVYADSGVNIDPTPDQLVEIARESVRTWSEVLGDQGEPVVAFLSFSTRGSAKHAAAEKMQKAADLFRAAYPEITADGEMQFDAAVDPGVGARKAPGSQVPGRANIFIFPNLDAGNICYKVTERLAGFAAYGPILQGLKRPYCDLSRGATAVDIATITLLSLVRAASGSSC